MAGAELKRERARAAPSPDGAEPDRGQGGREGTAPQPQKFRDWPVEGRFGPFGGRHVPEGLIPALRELELAHQEACLDPKFQRELRELLSDYGGRPTPLHVAERLTRWAGGARLYLKREDLGTGGTPALAPALGQALLARRLNKRRLVAATGSGGLGVATAMAGAVLGLKTEIYVDAADLERRRLLALRLEALGARLRPVRTAGTGAPGLRAAVDEALRAWAADPHRALYVGPAVGPHPYPQIVRDLQRVVGDELKGQILRKEGRLPDLLVADVGVEGAAVGAFLPFADERAVRLLAVEAEGAAPLSRGRVGVLHGAKTYTLQDEGGGDRARARTAALAPGLSYPAAAPELAFYRERGRLECAAVADERAVEAFYRLAELEGLLPAPEAAYALHAAVERARALGRGGLVVVVLAGRGEEVLELLPARRAGRRRAETAS